MQHRASAVVAQHSLAMWSDLALKLKFCIVLLTSFYGQAATLRCASSLSYCNSLGFMSSQAAEPRRRNAVLDSFLASWCVLGAPFCLSFICVLCVLLGRLLSGLPVTCRTYLSMSGLQRSGSTCSAEPRTAENRHIRKICKTRIRARWGRRQAAHGVNSTTLNACTSSKRSRK